MLGEEGVVEIESHWAATRRENQESLRCVERAPVCVYYYKYSKVSTVFHVEHFVRTIDGGGWQMIVAAFSE